MNIITLDQHLQEILGFVPQGDFPCSCGFSWPPFALASKGGPFLCGHCHQARDAQEWVEPEPDSGWQGEAGNGVRAIRNMMVAEWIWAVQPGSPLSASCRGKFADFFTRLHRLSVDFPEPALVIWPIVPQLEYAGD